jgi:hypothetical protein
MDNKDLYYNIKNVLESFSKQEDDYENVSADLLRVATNASSRYENGKKVGKVVKYKTDTKYIVIYSNDPDYNNVASISGHKKDFNFIDSDTYSYHEIKKYTLFVIGGLVYWNGTYKEDKPKDSWGRDLDRDRSKD